MADTLRSSFTLTYRSQRREIWKFYWKAWRSPKGLWRIWLLAIVLITAVMVALAAQHALGPREILEAGAAAILVCGFFVAYPQLAFKPQERVLTVNAGGIDTTIGAQSGHRGWDEIRAIGDSGDSILLVVARTGNAFVVPNRAFETAQDRADFLFSARTWHSAVQGDTAAVFV